MHTDISLGMVRKCLLKGHYQMIKDTNRGYKHALMNSLIPVVSVLGIYFIINLGSSIMTEIVFSRPGLGKLMVLAMKQRDYQVLQSVMVIYATLAIFINLFVDLVYGLIDPRIKYG